MADILRKGLSRDKDVRFSIADITKTAEEGRVIHGLTPLKTVIFSKLLCAGLMFGYELKEPHYLVTLKTDFSDRESYILTTADNSGKVKGYPYLPFEDVTMENKEQDPSAQNKMIREHLRTVLKDGLFTVIKDIGMRSPYHGTVTMITGEIARDITYYLSVSEQIPSIVGLSVVLNDDESVKKAVGFMVQLMPEAGESQISLLEQNVQKLPEIIDLLEMDISIDRIMSEIVLQNFDYDITGETEPRYSCDCSEKRFLKGLRLLSREELQEIRTVNSKFTVRCHYCNKEYEFNIEDVIDRKSDNK